MPATLDLTARRYLPEGDTAIYMNVSARTLQQWRRTGDGPPYKLISSRCIRYDRLEVDAWLDARTRTSTSDTGEAA